MKTRIIKIENGLKEVIFIPQYQLSYWDFLENGVKKDDYSPMIFKVFLSILFFWLTIPVYLTHRWECIQDYKKTTFEMLKEWYDEDTETTQIKDLETAKMIIDEFLLKRKNELEYEIENSRISMLKQKIKRTIIKYP